jgi:hypothetical protein
MNALAYVVGPRKGPGAAIFDLAQGLGFGAVLPFTSVAEAERQSAEAPLQFFLFAEVADLRTLAGAAQAIRFSTGGRLRFSPLIYFCASPSVETVRECAAMGFDDVITRPFTPARVSRRLARQVGTELVFFETASYFGPERRGRIEPSPRSDRAAGGGQHRRLEIVRHPVTGVNVISDDLQIVL